MQRVQRALQDQLVRQEELVRLDLPGQVVTLDKLVRLVHKVLQERQDHLDNKGNKDHKDNLARRVLLVQKVSKVTLDSRVKQANQDPRVWLAPSVILELGDWSVLLVSLVPREQQVQLEFLGRRVPKVLLVCKVAQVSQVILDYRAPLDPKDLLARLVL